MCHRKRRVDLREKTKEMKMDTRVEDEATRKRTWRSRAAWFVSDVWGSIRDLLAIGLVFVIIAVAIVAVLRLVCGAVKCDSLSRREYDGHTYILRNDWYRGGICHDPDCKCGRADN